MPPSATKSKLTIFIINIMVKVTRSLTLASFEKVSLVEYTCQIWSLCLLRLKVTAKVKVFLSRSYRVTNRHDKTRCSRIPLREQKQQNVFVRNYAPGGNNVLKAIFSEKVIFKVTRSYLDLCVNKKGIISWVCMQSISLYPLPFKSYTGIAVILVCL